MENLALLYGYEAYESTAAEQSLDLGRGQGYLLRLGLLSTLVGLLMINAAPQAVAALKRGDRGTSVRQVQSALRKLGYRVQVDGVFGANTEAAIRQFQRARRLTVDGIVGPATTNALNISSPASASRPAVGAVKVVTQGDRLNVRSGPGSQYRVIDRVANGATLEVTGRNTNGWLELARGGWVATQFVAGGTGGPIDDAPDGSASPYVRVVTTGTSLNIRSGPGTSFQRIDQLPNGTIIATTGQMTNGWIQLSQGGWIAERFTRPDQGPSIPDNRPSDSGNRPSGSTARVATAGSPLNVRTGPGFNYPILKVLNNGTVVRVSGKALSGWVELAEGGWVPNQFMR